MIHKSLAARIIGFIASLIFTVTAFLIVLHPDFFHLSVRIDLIFILILALLQFIAQSICFLNVWGEKGPRWNFVLFLSTLTMILIIVIGTIWIMNHLDYHMMVH